MYAPGTWGLSLCDLLLLCFGARTPDAGALVDASPFFPLLLFFFPIISTVDGAINGDQAKGFT